MVDGGAVVDLELTAIAGSLESRRFNGSCLPPLAVAKAAGTLLSGTAAKTGGEGVRDRA